MFNHVNVDLPKLLRENVDGSRMYLTPDGKKYPSVTTVLAEHGKEGIAAWRKKVGEKEANRISREATTRGTGVHSAIESYLSNHDMTDVEMMPNVKQLYVRMKEALNKIDNIHCLESSLYSHDLKLAGTVDCIAEYDGVLSVIDFKTSRRLKKKEHIANYFMQGAAYSRMYEEMTGVRAEQVVILIGVDSAPFPQVMKDPASDYINDLKGYINKYYEGKQEWNTLHSLLD